MYHPLAYDMISDCVTVGHRFGIVRRTTCGAWIALLLGCSSGYATDGILRMRLDSGEAVGMLASRADTTLLLVLDPRQCFSCGVDASKWSRFRPTEQKQALFILTREPIARERTGLTIRRIRPNAIIAGGQSDPGSTPRAYWVVGARVVRDGSLDEQRIKAAVTQFLTEGPTS